MKDKIKQEIPPGQIYISDDGSLDVIKETLPGTSTLDAPASSAPKNNEYQKGTSQTAKYKY